MTLLILRIAVGLTVVLFAFATPLVLDASEKSVGVGFNPWAPMSSSRIEAAVLSADNDDKDNDDDKDNSDDDDNNEDNNDEDNDEDNDDGGDNDEDNDDGGDNDEDNDDGGDNDEDNDDGGDNDDGDDFEDADNVAAPARPSTGGAPAASVGFDPSVAQASGVTTGADSSISLPGDRLVVRVFPWMPAGVSLTIRLIDPTTVPSPAGSRVGPLTFVLEAKDARGANLSSLPAEVNLSAHYTELEASGIDKAGLTLMWLDPADTQWKPAPKPGVDPASNYVAASVTALGTYTVAIR
jgi:hypothetical protein